MVEVPEEDQGPLVRERSLDLKLKVLEQRLTIKLIVGLLGAGVANHFVTAPPNLSTVTAATVLAAAYKFAIARFTF